MHHEWVHDESKPPDEGWYICGYCHIALWMSPRDLAYMTAQDTCRGSPEAELAYRLRLMEMRRGQSPSP